MPMAVVLSHKIMVSGCEYPMLESTVRRAAACCASANSALYSASPALATTHGMIAEKARIMPLILVGWSTSPRRKSRQQQIENATLRGMMRRLASVGSCRTW
jgi:hypothetical protein